MSSSTRKLYGIFMPPRGHLRNVNILSFRSEKLGNGFRTFSSTPLTPPVSHLNLNPTVLTKFSRNFHGVGVSCSNASVHVNGIQQTQPSKLLSSIFGSGVSTKNPTFVGIGLARFVSQKVISKKRTKRKAGSKVIMDEFGVRGYDHHHDEMTFPVVAYAVSDELNLEELRKGLVTQGLYKPTEFNEDLNQEDVIHSTAQYSIGDEPREIFFFREGTVVFWNISDLERFTVLKFVKPYQEESYKESEVMQESEYMLYANVDDSSTRLTTKGRILLNANSENSTNVTLEKYTFSNAMALSVKLGIWEATLETFVDSIEHITEELKHARGFKLNRDQVLQKAGELFALRHQLNLNSDLLDTPDFYWERDRLETLYQKTINYLSINRRTNVMNEKLNQCYELLELILSHLNDNHHVRLEWLIIWLITIEVGFEIAHVLDRYGYI